MEDYIIEEFKVYKVFLLSGIENDASIHIKIPSGIAVIRFLHDKLPDNKVVTKDDGSKIFKIHAPAVNYPFYIDIMRNEGPLFFFYDFKENVSYITTTDEPVGEGELQYRLPS
jgi:hypothetical protein